MFTITNDPSSPRPYIHWVLRFTDHPLWQDLGGIKVCEIVRDADAFSNLSVEEMMKSREFEGITDISAPRNGVQGSIS